MTINRWICCRLCARRICPVPSATRHRGVVWAGIHTGGPVDQCVTMDRQCVDVGGTVGALDLTLRPLAALS